MNITRGKIKRAQKAIIYGPEGVGKSTLAASLPDPIFIDAEGSTAQLDIARIDVGSWRDTIAALKALRDSAEFRTVVLDTIDWVERFGIADLLNRTGKVSIEDFGYGKGWVQVAESMGTLLGDLDKLIDAGKHVVLLAHSKVVRFAAPDLQGEHDRYELKLSKQTAPLIKEWADAVLFLNYRTKIIEVDGKKRGVGGKERVVHTARTAAYDAKNRHALPPEVEATADALAGIFGALTAKQALPVAEDFTMAKMTVICAGKEAEVNQYLVERGHIKSGQTYRDLDSGLVEKIVANPDRFLAAVGGAK